MITDSFPHFRISSFLMTGKSLFLALSLLAIVLSQRKHASQLLGQGCSKTIAVDQHSLAACRHARDDQVETSAHADGGPR